VVEQVAVGVGVGPVHAGRCAGERAAQRGGVDAEAAGGHDGPAGVGQVGAELRGDVHAVAGRSTRPDDGHGTADTAFGGSLRTHRPRAMPRPSPGAPARSGSLRGPVVVFRDDHPGAGAGGLPGDGGGLLEQLRAGGAGR
jgi:hypothetical protein